MHLTYYSFGGGRRAWLMMWSSSFPLSILGFFLFTFLALVLSFLFPFFFVFFFFFLFRGGKLLASLSVEILLLSLEEEEEYLFLFLFFWEKYLRDSRFMKESETIFLFSSTLRSLSSLPTSHVHPLFSFILPSFLHRPKKFMALLLLPSLSCLLHNKITVSRMFSN